MAAGRDYHGTQGPEDRTPRRCRNLSHGRAAVVTVSVEVAELPLSMTDEVRKLQAAPAGEAVQDSVAVPVKPLLGVKVIVLVADIPAVTVAAPLEAETEKLADGGCATLNSSVCPSSRSVLPSPLKSRATAAPPPGR